MVIGQFVTNRLLVKLCGVWLVALLVAYLVATSTEFTLFQIAGVIGMLGSVGIFTLQYHRLSADADQREDLESIGAAESDSSRSTADRTESSTQRVSATDGLSPEERRVQNALIREAYQQFREEPFTFWPTSRGGRVVSPVKENFEDIDNDVVDRVWQFSKDDGFFKRRPGKKSWQLTPKALWRADVLGEEILLDDSVQEEILDVLLQAYRENPTHSRIDRDELLSAVGVDAGIVDQNLWLSREKGYVETHAYIGSGAGYSEVEITKLGREVTQ